MERQEGGEQIIHHSNNSIDRQSNESNPQPLEPMTSVQCSVLYLFQWHSLHVGHDHAGDGGTDIVQDTRILPRLCHSKEGLEDLVIVAVGGESREGGREGRREGKGEVREGKRSKVEVRGQLALVSWGQR